MNKENTSEETVRPPFPENMTFKEMLSGLFNLYFMTPEEQQTIFDSGEMYANGCLNYLRKTEIEALEKENEGLKFDNAQLQSALESEKLSHQITQVRIKELEKKINDLTMENMTHEYNEAEAEKFFPEFKRQIEEPLKEKIEALEKRVKELVDYANYVKRIIDKREIPMSFEAYR